MSEWISWYDQRPTDIDKTYRWRVSKRLILGLEMQPEWSGKLVNVGMGYAENEYWAPYSNWDGYQRTVDASLEWREALPDEMEIKWNGFDLLPSPFTGMMPDIVPNPRWIGAPPYILESIGLKAYMISQAFWRNAKDLQTAWNTRRT